MQKSIIFFILIGIAIIFAIWSIFDIFKEKAKVTQSIDPSTYSNFDEIQAVYWNLSINVDFNNTVISGNNIIHFRALIDGVKSVNLDSKGLKIKSVKQISGNSSLGLSFKITKNTKLSFLGEKIEIALQRTLSFDENLILEIDYQTSNAAEALSWLKPEQTASKTLPYLFSQCEPISCRSIAPMQDTPAIKTPWSASVHVPKAINVFLSANHTGTVEDGEYKYVTFRSTMPMAFYVFAIVAGNVELKKVGARTGVITEPTNIVAYANELSDLEKYLSTVEDYIGAYRWGVYNIVLLPPSFPFGGMENPLLTFASPTIIVGDKSGVFVAIHEIAHSWTGNLVTCINWENYWLNEGFTVFLERKASQKLYGSDFYKAEVYEGNVSLTDDLNQYGNENEVTKLHPLLVGRNPDVGDDVPYDKGFQFLAFLESLIGEDQMQSMLRGYVSKYALKSIDVYVFENFVTNYIRQNFAEKERNEIFSKLNFDDWIELPGPTPVPLEISSSEIDEVLTLAKEFVNGGGSAKPAKSGSLKSKVKVIQYIFLEELIKLSRNVTNAVIEQLEQLYQFNESKDAEILQRWFTLTTKINFTANIKIIENFLSSVGRLKMIEPLYTNLAKSNKSLANSIFQKNIGFYHPLAVESIREILK